MSTSFASAADDVAHGASAAASFATKATHASSWSPRRQSRQQGRWTWRAAAVLAASLAIVGLDWLVFDPCATSFDDIKSIGKYLAASLLGGSFFVEIVLSMSVAMLAVRRLLSPKAPMKLRVNTAPSEGASLTSIFGAAAAATSTALAAASAAAKSCATTEQHQQAPRLDAHTAKAHAAVDAALERGDAEAAAEVLTELERRGARPAPASFHLVIRTFAKRRDAAAAELWLAKAEAAWGSMLTASCYNVVLDCYAKSDNGGAAFNGGGVGGRAARAAAASCEALLERMLAAGVAPTRFSYGTVVYAHARRGDVLAGERWLGRMLSAGLEPDQVVFNSLVHAYSVRGDMPGAERCLEQMRSLGLAPGVLTYSTVIDACAKSGNVESAEQWLTAMVDDGVPPNVVTYSALIDACAKVGDRHRAERWHRHMTDRGVAPNAHTYSAVINACAKSAGGPERGEAAERWLDECIASGIPIDTAVFSCAIDACASDTERASRIFRRLEGAGLRPHAIAFTALARSFAYRGDWIKVESIGTRMASEGVSENEYFVYARLLAYARARPREPERAEEYFRRSVQRGIEVNSRVLDALGRAIGRAQATSLAREVVHNARGGRPLPTVNPRQTRRSGAAAVALAAAA